MSDRVFVGTRKGLFRLEKGSAGSWGIEGRDFIGDNVNIEAVGTGLRKSELRSLRYEVASLGRRRRIVVGDRRSHLSRSAGGMGGDSESVYGEGGALESGNDLVDRTGLSR